MQVSPSALSSEPQLTPWENKDTRATLMTVGSTAGLSRGHQTALSQDALLACLAISPGTLFSEVRSGEQSPQLLGALDPGFLKPDPTWPPSSSLRVSSFLGSTSPGGLLLCCWLSSCLLFASRRVLEDSAANTTRWSQQLSLPQKEERFAALPLIRGQSPCQVRSPPSSTLQEVGWQGGPPCSPSSPDHMVKLSHRAPPSPHQLTVDRE